MLESLDRGYKLAALTLAVELVLALGLVSDSLGIFVILTMPAVGMVWLPAALMILSDLKGRDAGPSLLGYVIASLCGLAGSVCVYTIFKWTVLSMLVR